MDFYEIKIIEFCKINQWRCEFDGHKAFVATPMGLWMFNFKDDGVHLSHHNYFKGEEGLDKFMQALAPKKFTKFHKQRDAFSPFECLYGALCYVRRHDRIKALEQKGVEYMPTGNKKERKWKKQAKNRKRKAGIKQTMKLFEMLENKEVQ